MIHHSAKPSLNQPDSWDTLEPSNGKSTVRVVDKNVPSAAPQFMGVR